MRVVHRFQFDIQDGDPVIIENCIRIVHAEAVGNDRVDIWAEVMTDISLLQILPRYEVVVVGTGMPFEEPWAHEATTGRTPSGLIWHVISRPID